MAPRTSGHPFNKKLMGTSTPGIVQVVGDPPSNQTKNQLNLKSWQKKSLKIMEQQSLYQATLNQSTN